MAVAQQWSAKQYVAFEDERTRPVRDLVAAMPPIEVAAGGGRLRMLDIGCGPGNSTEVLAARFAGAAITGMDNSADMIAAARVRLPGMTFRVADIETWAYEPAAAAAPLNVILANAVLQWLPDHARLFPALIGKLAGGGVLAVQVPDNLEEPAHVLMREIAADGPWAAKLAGGAARSPIAAASWYHELLRSAGCKTDVWRTTYHHPLAGGAAAVVEWFKGSGLRPYLAPLDEGERSAYLTRYTEAVARAYPPLSDGAVLLPFPRLFIVAVR